MKAGLVASLNRPGGNVTGISLIGSALEAKRLELLHQIIPGDAPIGALVNPNYPDAALQESELHDAARVIGRSVEIQRAGGDNDIDAAIAAFGQKRAGGFLVCQDAFFNSRRERPVALAARYKLPAITTSANMPKSAGWCPTERTSVMATARLASISAKF